MSDRDPQEEKMTTAANHDMKPLTLADIEEAVRRVKALPKCEWMLVAPDGRMWRTSKPEELFAVLAPYHPLLRMTP